MPATKPPAISPGRSAQWTLPNTRNQSWTYLSLILTLQKYHFFFISSIKTIKKIINSNFYI